MHTILMFVQKDLIQQAKRLLYGVAILTMFSIIAGLTNGAAIGFPIITVMPAAFAMTTVTTTAYEDDQGGLVFLRLLPIAPKWLALGRYISALIMLIGLYACALLPLLIIRPQFLDLTALGFNYFGSFCSAVFMIGVTIAVYYRYGYRAVRYGFLVVFFGIMLLTSLATTLDLDGKFSGPPPAWLANLFASPGRVLTLIGLIMLGIYSLLCRWASNSISKRDL